jgi:transketolase
VPEADRAEFERRIAGTLPAGLEAAVKAAADALATAGEAMPIRQGSQKAVAFLAGRLPELLGGSADLTGSVLSRPAELPQLDPASFRGRHLPYGIREHGMAAAMNGIALHGGFIPFGGTYFTFSDYARPAIRLAALMGARVVYLFTHDSIGVGEDGPTHQPIEQLASLRAMPGIRVYRPADAVEALECWFDAIAGDGPSAMVVARQKVAPARTAPREGMPSRRGGYVLHEADGPRDATLIATGSVVEIAMAVRDRLAAEESGRRSCRCRRWTSSSARIEATATPCSGRRRATSSRPDRPTAGTATPATAAGSSPSTASAIPARRRSSTPNSG